MSGEITVLLQNEEIVLEVSPEAVTEIIEIAEQGPPGAPGIFPEEASLELAWSEAYPSNFTETSYALGKIDKVEIWTSSAKTLKIFTKQFNYTLGVLSSVVITNNITNKTMTKTLLFSSGKLVSVNRVVSP